MFVVSAHTVTKLVTVLDAYSSVVSSQSAVSNTAVAAVLLQQCNACYIYIYIMLFTLSITARCAPSYALHVRARLLQWIDQWLKWHTLSTKCCLPFDREIAGHVRPIAQYA